MVGEHIHTNQELFQLLDSERSLQNNKHTRRTMVFCDREVTPNPPPSPPGVTTAGPSCPSKAIVGQAILLRGPVAAVDGEWCISSPAAAGRDSHKTPLYLIRSDFLAVSPSNLEPNI